MDQSEVSKPENINDDVNDENDIDIPEPQNMKLIRQEYNLLQKAISELGSKVSAVLNKQETEFLTAYKAHMRNVTRDFQSLKNEMDETTAAIENNVLVRRLENDREMYKKEALHLDDVLTKTKQREKTLAEKVDELEHDRTWLSNQLKEVMKEKNALERRLDNLEQKLEDLTEVEGRDGIESVRE